MKTITTLRVLYCGKGDTLLIETSPGKDAPSEWALIDCHLTKVSGARQRIRDIITREQITKLKFVCLSHPDRDHYFGMYELLREHFYDSDKDQLSIDEFWDAGVDFRLLSSIAERLGTKAIKQELDELYNFIMPLSLSDKIDHYPMPQGRLSKIDFGQFDFFSLSPRTNRVDRFNQQTLDDILGAPYEDLYYQEEESNNLSVVLVLMHKTLPLNIILGGDATAKAWEEALNLWPKFVEKLKRASPNFAAVKVSHHGAAGSLYPKLYEGYCKERQSIAILTVGPNDQNHPHKKVLDMLSARNIRTYATCWPIDKSTSAKRCMPLPGSRSSEMINRSPRLTGYGWADIKVFIQSNGRLTCSSHYLI